MIKYAYIETTSYCNLQCVNCNRESVVDRPEHMPIFRFRQLLSKLHGQPIREAKLMGMGEPFLHPGFSTITRLFKESFPNCFLISATNGQFKVTDNFYNALQHLDMLYVSIDGYGHRFEQLRPPAKWDKMVRFLDSLATRKADTTCKIALNTTVSPGFVDDLDKLNDLVLEYGLDELRINLVQNWDESGVADNIYTEHEMLVLDRYKNRIKGKSPWTWSDCFWVHDGFYSTASGDVKACCMNTATKPFGNIFNQTIEQIHNTPAYTNVRNGCVSDNPTEHCKTCSYKQLSPILERYV